MTDIIKITGYPASWKWQQLIQFSIIFFIKIIVDSPKKHRWQQVFSIFIVTLDQQKREEKTKTLVARSQLSLPTFQTWRCSRCSRSHVMYGVTAPFLDGFERVNCWLHCICAHILMENTLWISYALNYIMNLVQKCGNCTHCFSITMLYPSDQNKKHLKTLLKKSPALYSRDEKHPVCLLPRSHEGTDYMEIQSSGWRCTNEP